MPGQKSLTAFFKPLNGVKRPLVTTSNVETPEKTTQDKSCDESAVVVTPDAKRRMLSNQIQAKIRLQHKNTCALHFSIGETWFKALSDEFDKPYFLQLSEFLAGERSKSQVFPPEAQVWSWTQHFEINQVKVVIIGQDPYHGVNQAHGLCFSVQKGVPSPPSLVNIYKELAQDVEGFVIPKHGNLTGWARQGVLLLNACLTVRAHAANSHQGKGWEQVTDSTIKWISDNCDGVIFLLWGSYAQKKAAIVDKKKHHLLNAPHPSPLSAHRGFLGCKHFSKCNALLEKQGKQVIDWSDLPVE